MFRGEIENVSGTYGELNQKDKKINTSLPPPKRKKPGPLDA